MQEDKSQAPVVEANEAMTPRDINTFLSVPVSIVIAGALIAGALFFGLRGTTDTPAAPQGGAVLGLESNATEEVTLGTNPVLGNPDAELLIVEFSDYQCPFCGRFFEQTEPQIMQKYVDSGVARYAYRDFAFLDGFVGLERGESHLASEAARCAQDQGAYWRYHDKLFTSQNGENKGAFGAENLKRFAMELGLDGQAFNSCLDQGKYREAVIADTQDAARLGVNGTPTLFIGKGTIVVDPEFIRANVQAQQRIIRMDSGSVAIVGALPWAQIEPVIEEVLKGKSR